MSGLREGEICVTAFLAGDAVRRISITSDRPVSLASAMIGRPVPVVADAMAALHGLCGQSHAAAVHFAAAGGAITSFMDRAFYAGINSGKDIFYLKPAAAVVSARRAGTTVTFDQLNKYFTISEMPVISSRYWNMVHGARPEDMQKDQEGMQIMRILGRNMAWFLKCKEAGSKAGVPLPQREKTVFTNFIRP